MKVQCVMARGAGSLTQDKIYEVTKEIEGNYLICNDRGFKCCYSKDRFKLIEGTTTMEVGKKYKHKLLKDYSATVLFCDHEGALLEVPAGRTYLHSADFQYWTEVKEPLSIIQYINVYKIDGKLEFGSRFYKTLEDAEQWGKGLETYVDTIVQSYIEQL